jgi:AcrR family transcriptional regulator
MDAATTRTRSTRDRPAKAPLSREAVIDAALDVCRAEGLDAVTMRRVATELDTGAASLYVYVRNRTELVQAMGDRAVSVLALETPDPARWREQLHLLLARMLRAFEEYPGLAASTLATLPSTEAPFVLVENLLGLLLAGGIGRQDAAWGCDILSLVTTATAIENDVRRDRGPVTNATMADFVEGLRTTFLGLPVDRFPLVVALANEMVTGDGGDRFRFAIDALLDGMVARAGRARA